MMRFVQGRRLLTSLVRSMHYRSTPRPQWLHYQPESWPPVESEYPFHRQPESWPPVEREYPFHRQPESWPPVERVHPYDLNDPFGRRLESSEMERFRYEFSEQLGLPKPPETKTEETGEKFAVKLLKIDEDKIWKLLGVVAWIKSTEEVKSMTDLVLEPLKKIVCGTPSVIKQGVSKEEADEIIAKLQAVGGVAVMEPLK